MLKIASTTIRQAFAFMPERSSRFFSVRMELNQELPLQDVMLTEHQKHLTIAQEKGQIIFSGKQKDRKVFEYLFQSPNELQPFYFVKRSPFHLHNMISDYKITQIEMQNKVKDKELAPAYLRE